MHAAFARHFLKERRDLRIDYNNVRQFPAILQLLSFFLLDQDKN